MEVKEEKVKIRDLWSVSANSTLPRHPLQIFSFNISRKCKILYDWIKDLFPIYECNQCLPLGLMIFEYHLSHTKEKMENSDIQLFIVSSISVASDYIYGSEDSLFTSSYASYITHSAYPKEVIEKVKKLISKAEGFTYNHYTPDNYPYTGSREDYIKRWLDLRIKNLNFHEITPLRQYMILKKFDNK